MQIDDPDPDELLQMELCKKPDADGNEDADKREELDETNRRLSQEHLHRLFVFSLVWSAGALLDLDGAKKFDAFLREKFPNLEWPSSRLHPEATVFDFVVNADGTSKSTHGTRIPSTLTIALECITF